LIVMSDLQPLLVLLIFVPTALAGAICAVLVLALVRFMRVDLARAKTIVATCWWLGLSAILWIGCDRLMAGGRADNAAPFAAILIWVVVVLPGPLLASRIVGLNRTKHVQ
jgi:hypothetical protein